ncbi:MAG: GerMN domain-containing protein [Leptolyngbya sp. SIO1E4]|nr:GerMN domain-containing protein [Leptolyngbya sp. SIO1E4]
MEDQTPRRRPPLGIIIALVAIALSAGSATAWFTWRAIAPRAPQAEFPEIEIEGETLPEGFEAPTSDPINVPDPPEAEIAAEPNQRQSTIYWVSTQGEEIALAPVAVDLPEGETPENTLTLAFADLMTGPADSNGEAATTIPEQTELVALTVESDGVHVDLSNEFTVGGGSASMIGRLAQVVYTATTLEPETPVWISVDGSPLTLLGGEGLEVRQPVTRSDLEADFGVKEPTD